MSLHQVLWALFYVLIAVSLLCSAVVITVLRTYGSLQTAATQLVLYLHIVLLLEEVASIPRIYGHVDALCETVAFIHLYTGLADALTVGLLVWSHRRNCFGGALEFTSWLQKYGAAIVFGIPLITLLPFTTNSYANFHDVWCTMHTDTISTDIWAIAICYFWVWFVLLIATITLIDTFYRVYKANPRIGFKLFSTIGMYCIISICAWIPRTVARFSHFGGEHLDSVSFVYAYMVVFISGILFTIVFKGEVRGLLTYERLSEHLLAVHNGVFVENSVFLHSPVSASVKSDPDSSSGTDENGFRSPISAV
jgi:hypothetical protein